MTTSAEGFSTQNQNVNKYNSQQEQSELEEDEYRILCLQEAKVIV
jgi:hypothetical protein